MSILDLYVAMKLIAFDDDANYLQWPVFWALLSVSIILHMWHLYMLNIITNRNMGQRLAKYFICVTLRNINYE